MPEYRIIAISDEIAEEALRDRRAPGYGHPVHEEIATGAGPCRRCLRSFEVGKERRILFTHDPFHGAESLPLPGPVYTHAHPCPRYPEDGGFPEGFFGELLTFNAYARGRRLRAQVHVESADPEPIVHRLLSRDEVDYIHVRNTKAGCFIFAIERTVPGGGASERRQESQIMKLPENRASIR